MLVTRIRSVLLLGWFLCLLSTILAYIIAYFGPEMRPDTGVMLASLGIVIGLLVPQLTLILEFLLGDTPKSTKTLDRHDAYVVVGMCIIYWLVFCGALWAGLVFRAFSSAADGSGVERNTALVVSISGPLSFLAIKPTVKLFHRIR
jgi:hypothetical protein